MRIMADCHLINAEFTERSAKLIFLRAKMATVDELMDGAKNESMTFVEFLECIARVAEASCYPSDAAGPEPTCPLVPFPARPVWLLVA